MVVTLVPKPSRGRNIPGFANLSGKEWIYGVIDNELPGSSGDFDPEAHPELKNAIRTKNHIKEFLEISLIRVRKWSSG